MVAKPTLPDMYTQGLIASVQEKIDEACRTGETVNAVNQIFDELHQNNLAEFGVQLDCETVGEFPNTRSSLVVDAYGSQDHGCTVLKVGYCKKKAADATCVWCPPPPHDKELIEFNKMLQQQQLKGSIPPT